MSDDKLTELYFRLIACTQKDWRLDEEILRVFGSIRRASRLGINGRSGGSDRYFGPNADPFGHGSSLPSPTKDEASRRKWAKKLQALIDGKGASHE